MIDMVMALSVYIHRVNGSHRWFNNHTGGMNIHYNTKIFIPLAVIFDLV